jgi:hypothetical protein
MDCARAMKRASPPAPRHTFAVIAGRIGSRWPSCRRGRRPRPKSDRLAPKVLALVGNGRSYRLIGRELGLSKNTVAEIVKRSRVTSAAN